MGLYVYISASFIYIWVSLSLSLSLSQHDYGLFIVLSYIGNISAMYNDSDCEYN